MKVQCHECYNDYDNVVMTSWWCYVNVKWYDDAWNNVWTYPNKIHWIIANLTRRLQAIWEVNWKKKDLNSKIEVKFEINVQGWGVRNEEWNQKGESESKWMYGNKGVDRLSTRSEIKRQKIS